MHDETGDPVVAQQGVRGSNPLSSTITAGQRPFLRVEKRPSCLSAARRWTEIRTISRRLCRSEASPPGYAPVGAWGSSWRISRSGARETRIPGLLSKATSSPHGWCPGKRVRVPTP